MKASELMANLNKALEAADRQPHPALYVPRYVYDQDPEAAEQVAREYGFNGVHIGDPLPTDRGNG